jgi:hypothetical protein
MEIAATKEPVLHMYSNVEHNQCGTSALRHRVVDRSA